MAAIEGHPLHHGDFVAHCRWKDDSEDGDRHVGHVVGFGPDNKWVRVKTLDGRRRLWLDEHIYNVDAVCKEGRYA